MEISIVGPVYPYRGGIAHHTAQLVQALQEAGHIVHVISFKQQFPAFLYPGKSDLDPSRNPLRTNAEFKLHPLFPWTWARTVKGIAAAKPDVVIFQWWTTFWAIPFGWMTRRLQQREIPTTVLIHNVMPHEPKPWDQWLVKQGIQHAQAFIVQSQSQMDLLQSLFPQAMKFLCPMPGYRLVCSISLSKDQARNQLQISTDASLLLFFGLIRPYKGLRVLIEALAILHELDDHPLLIVAGEFWEDKQPYLVLIEKNRLSDQVIIMDRYLPDEEATALFSAVDILVAPYTGGTQSAVASLGLGYDLPMVVSEIVARGIDPKHQKNLIVVPPGDAQALARGIRTMLGTARLVKSNLPKTDSDWGAMVHAIEVTTASLQHQPDPLRE